jgi:hypothetical protein
LHIQVENVLGWDDHSLQKETVMIKRSAFAAVGLAAAAVALASPVWAEPLEGSYTMTRSGPEGSSDQVILTPCGPDCTNWRYTAPGNLPEGINFHLHGNQWVNDNNSAMYFDKDSLKGSQGSLSLPNGNTIPATTFTLTRNG